MHRLLVETHCHLYHSQFDSDREACLERAEEAGVRRLIVVGADLESSRQAVDVAGRHPGRIFATVGVHPHDAKAWDIETEQWITDACNRTDVVAIGEIGFDFYRNLSSREEQERAFRRQMELADDLAMPVVIHCREAFEDVYSMLAQFPKVSGVMHCWAGDLEQSRRILDLGWFLGVGGTLTYKRSDAIRESVLAAPFDRILLETDAPYLAPEPFRGKRNEPAHVRTVAERLAEMKGAGLEELAAQTSRNAETCFPRLRPHSGTAVGVSAV